jgi:FKBP-type peptidyl-prolyl cis-trans isomerase
MRLHLAVVCATAALLAACAQDTKNFTPKTDDEKQLYTMGAVLARNLESFNLTDQELAVVKAGLDQGARGQSKIEQEEMEKLFPKIQEMQGKRIEAAGVKAKEEGAAYLTKAAGEKGVEKLASGILVKTTQEGTGAKPAATDTVKVHYEGKLINGKVFDSSIKRKEPIDFPLTGVIACWTEGVQQMKVGGKAQLTCPSDLAYGAEGRPPQIPGNSVLIFDVELLEILKAEPAVEAAAPPADAHKAH